MEVNIYVTLSAVFTLTGCRKKNAAALEEQQRIKAAQAAAQAEARRKLKAKAQLRPAPHPGTAPASSVAVGAVPSHAHT